MLRLIEKSTIVFSFLLFSSFAAFGWCLNYSFVGDDFLFLEDAYRTWSCTHFYALLTYPFQTMGNGFWRPFFYGWFNGLYFFLGEIAVSYHLVSIGLHAFNGFLLWQFLDIQNKSRWNLCGSLLMVVYPVAWEAIAWICTMSDLLVAACMLESAIFFLRFEQSGSIKKLLFAAFWGITAILFKECGVIVFPLLGLLFVEGLARRSERKPKWCIAIPFFLITGLLLILYVFITFKHVQEVAGILPHYSFSPLAMVRTLSYNLLYLTQPFSFIPFPVEGWLKLLLFWPRGSLFGLLAASIASVFFLCSAIWAAPRYRFYILWIILALLPPSTFTDYHSSRYLYVATVPFCMLMNELLRNLIWESNGKISNSIKPFFGIVFGCLIVLFLLTNWSASGKKDYIHIYNETQNYLKRMDRAIPYNIPDYEVWWVEEKSTPVPFIPQLLNRMNRIKKCRSIIYYTKEEYERERKTYQRGTRIAVILNGRNMFPLSLDKMDNYSERRERLPFLAVEVPPGTVIVTDDRGTVDNLVGKVDLDPRGERALAIRWNFGETVYSAYHLYVREDQCTPEFLAAIPASQNYYEWYPGNPNNASLLAGGPRLEREYRFILYGLIPGRNPDCLETEATVLFEMDCR